jgi:hypothetical protein
VRSGAAAHRARGASGLGVSARGSARVAPDPAEKVDVRAEGSTRAAR